MTVRMDCTKSNIQGKMRKGSGKVGIDQILRRQLRIGRIPDVRMALPIDIHRQLYVAARKARSARHNRVMCASVFRVTP